VSYRINKTRTET